MTKYSYSVFAKAGCFVCHGDKARWTARNAQGVAAQHAQKTGHEVWVETTTYIRYNPTDKDKT